MLNHESILPIGSCQIRAGVAAMPQGFFPASHKWATRAKIMKKGTSAENLIPFEYCYGAEGGI